MSERPLSDGVIHGEPTTPTVRSWMEEITPPRWYPDGGAPAQAQSNRIADGIRTANEHDGLIAMSMGNGAPAQALAGTSMDPDGRYGYGLCRHFGRDEYGPHAGPGAGYATSW
jgi:hypothetical protein